MTSRSLTVCHITTAHARRDTRIFRKECVSLARAGHDVHLVVGDGQGREVADGVTIHDLGRKPVSRLRRMTEQPRRARKVVAAVRPDVVHFHDPELLPLGRRLAGQGLRVVYDVHEDVPSQILSKSWIPSWVRPTLSTAFRVYEHSTARRLAGVVAATPHIAHLFADLKDRAICVNNFPMAEELAPPALPVERLARVCYAGVITRERGIRELIHALPLAPGVRLTLCGTISGGGLEAELRAEPGWGQVDYRGEVARGELARVMAESAAGVVTYLPLPNHVDAQPTKLFEYMSASLPVIASNFPLWRTFVEESGAGVCVDPASPESIAAAIRTLTSDLTLSASIGRAGRNAVERQFNWAAEADKLIAFYARL